MPRASLPSLPFPECQLAYGSEGWPVLAPTLRQHPGFTLPWLSILDMAASPPRVTSPPPEAACSSTPGAPTHLQPLLSSPRFIEAGTFFVYFQV